MTITPAAKIVIYIGIAAFIVLYGVSYSQRVEQENAQQASSTAQQAPQNMMTRQQVLDRVSIKTVKEGTGPQSKAGDQVRVNYRGTLDDGTVFDDSYARNEPFEFTLGNGSVIPGWDVGVQGMRVGEVRQLVIPPDVAYGNHEVGPIPPNSTLHFAVEMLSIKPSATDTAPSGE